jgi:hypothetical protein
MTDSTGNPQQWGGGWGPPAPGWVPPQAPKPGIVALRPLGLTEILDGAITAIRAHPRAMLGLSAVVLTAVTVLQTLLQWASLRTVGASMLGPLVPQTGLGAPVDDLASLGLDLATVASVLVGILVQMVLAGLLTLVVSRAVIGQQMPVGEAWSAVRGRVPALLGATVLIALAVVGVVVVTVLPAVALSLVGVPGVVLVLVWVATFFAAIVAGAYVYTALALAGPVVVLERRGPFAALGRSRALVRGSFWRVLGILLLAAVITTVVSLILQTPFLVAGFLLGFALGDGAELLFLAITALGTVLAGTVTYPFSAAVTVLVYLDRRIRREGLDLELARDAGLTPPGTSATPGQGAPGYGGPGYPPPMPPAPGPRR